MTQEVSLGAKRDVVSVSDSRTDVTHVPSDAEVEPRLRNADLHKQAEMADSVEHGEIADDDVAAKVETVRGPNLDDAGMAKVEATGGNDDTTAGASLGLSDVGIAVVKTELKAEACGWPQPRAGCSRHR